LGHVALGADEGGHNVIERFGERACGTEKALLEELNFVHKAISQAKSHPEASVEWIAKLEKWHDELHALIEGIPKEG
jgi:hypothetical protein